MPPNRFSPVRCPDIVLVVIWALGLRLLFAALTADTYDPDEFVVLTLSRDFSHGAVPYRDFMFFHPPGVLVLYRMLHPLVNWWWPSARIVIMLIDTVTAALVWRIGMALYGRSTALVAGLLYGASPLALISAVRVGQDPIITALGIAGVAILLLIPSRKGAVLAGACLGLAVWFKYPAIIFLPVYVLIAPRRALITVAALAASAGLAFVPFAAYGHAIYQQTVIWQLLQRTPTDLLHRVGGVVAYLLLLNPLAAGAMLHRRQPAWLASGFGLGTVFVFSSQVYYHYFVPALPFAALLAAPLVVPFVRRSLVPVLATGVSLAVAWGGDIAWGSGPARLFISASNFSAIHPTLLALDRTTRRGQVVLTDQLEYAYFAQRPALADYFWNMNDVVSARYLERRLPGVGAVVETQHVAPSYPAGLTSYLSVSGYRHVDTGSTRIWLIPQHGPAMRELPVLNIADSAELVNGLPQQVGDG